jgi:hypothetical protein
MLTKILIGVVAIIAVFLIVVALQPSAFRVTRQATITAAPDAVFAYVNDLHNWDAWSPWAKLDPEMKKSYEGASSGEGAIYAWNGNKEVGEGRTTIIESRPSELIHIKLEFLRPFACRNDVEFTFEPQDDGTLVTWKMWGENNFIAKAVHLFMDMDKMVGGDFEKGLANLKSVVEGVAQP